MSLSLDLPVGDTGAVPLERYATAGYVWYLDQVPPGIADARIVPRAGPGSAAPGAVTHETLELRAVSVGIHELVLSLRRPWEKVATRELRIRVEAR